jgi:hypothetical protein
MKYNKFEYFFEGVNKTRDSRDNPNSHTEMMIRFTLLFLLAASIALAIDKCSDGLYSINPDTTSTFSQSSCPSGTHLATLSTLPAHFRAARLLYTCKGPAHAAWIASTNGGETFGGELAVVAPRSLEAGAAAGDVVGGVVKAAGASLPAICQLD